MPFNWNIAFLLATTFLCYAIVVPYMPDFEGGGGEGVREPQMHPGNNQCSYVSNTYRCDLLIASCFSLLNVIVHNNCSFSSFLRVRAKKCRISVISRLHDTTLSLWDVPVVNNLIRKKNDNWSNVTVSCSMASSGISSSFNCSAIPLLWPIVSEPCLQPVRKDTEEKNATAGPTGRKNKNNNY